MYESELLNVKLKTSQDKTKTTWDLEFDRSETSVSEQTVKFKLNLDKAGLKDAEIKQDDKTLDMREGIVSAVLKSQSTHLILTAISTNEDKHDITLPVTELGLYDEKNGENKLPVDNRSVDLTMAFEKVAEIAKESSSSETVTEAVAKEEEKSEDKQGEKAHRVIDGSDNGFITKGGATSPIEALDATLDEDDQVQLAVIDSDDRTTPVKNGTNTDGNNFQIWSSDATNTTYHESGDATNGQTSINIYQKFDASVADIGGSVTNYGPGQAYRTKYHNQYLTSGTGNNNQSAYNIEFSSNIDANVMKNAKFQLFYDNVGYYVDTYGDVHEMGAALTITNVISVDPSHDKMGSVRYIDLPNNIYSGVMYHGIESLDMEIRFYAVDSSTRKFTSLLDLTDSDSLFTFNSLNNFGAGSSTTWNDTSANSPHWNVNQTGISTSIWAETVSPLNALGGTINEEVWTNGQVVGPGGAEEGSAMIRDDDNQKWYSTAHGNYDWETTNTVQGNWEDNIDDTDTFPMGSVAYTTSGTAQSFRMFTGTGNTWQTLTCANNKPMQLNAPRKLVTRDNIGSGDTQTAYQKANQEMVEGDTAAASLISQTRKDFTDKWTGDYDASFYQQRENAVTAALTPDAMEDLKEGYGDLYNKNLAITSTSLIGGDPYFTFDYWIMQPTYDTGTYSLVKPQTLEISDTLDLGVTLEDVDLTASVNSTKSLVVYNTDVGTFDPKTDYKVSITPDPADTTKQKIVVEFTPAGLAAAKFNGGNIAVDLDVKVSAYVTDSDDKYHDFNNVANVMTKLTNPGGINTNVVPVHITPKPEASLQITKMDNKGNKLQNAMFKLEKIGEPNSWDGSTWNGWTDMTQDPDEIDLSHIEGSSSFIWEKLTIGKYQLSEITTPGGYTGLTQNVVFYVSGVLGANKEQILQEIKTDAGDTYSADVIANWISKMVVNSRIILLGLVQ